MRNWGSESEPRKQDPDEESFEKVCERMNVRMEPAMVRRAESNLCGFEGAKPMLQAKRSRKAEQAKQKRSLSNEVRRPFDGRSDV